MKKQIILLFIVSIAICACVSKKPEHNVSIPIDKRWLDSLSYNDTLDYSSIKSESFHASWTPCTIRHSQVHDNDSLFLFTALSMDNDIAFMALDFRVYITLDSLQKSGKPLLNGVKLYDLGVANISMVDDQIVTVYHGFKNTTFTPRYLIGKDIALIDEARLPIHKEMFKSGNTFYKQDIPDSLDIEITGLLPKRNGTITNISIVGKAYKTKVNPLNTSHKVTGQKEYFDYNNMFIKFSAYHEFGGLSGALVREATTKQVIGLYSGRMLLVDYDIQDTITLGYISLIK